MPKACVPNGPTALGTSIWVKFPSGSRRKPCWPVLSIKLPTICPASLMPEATVVPRNAPGTSIWVKLKVTAFADEPPAIGAMTRKTTMESIVQQEFNDRALPVFVSMMFLPLAYIGIHQIPGRLAAIFHAIGARRNEIRLAADYHARAFRRYRRDHVQIARAACPLFLYLVCLRRSAASAKDA